MKRLYSFYKDKICVEVLSGGMVLPKVPVHISATAAYVENEYSDIEKLTGVRFGEDYLWHIKHPHQSDWYPNSEKPAIALCIFKELFPEMQVSVAADLQYALHFEGRDLTDDETYGTILEKYNFSPELFYSRLHENEYKERAYYEFALCNNLQVSGYPSVFLQASESKFFLLARGYTSYDELKQRLDDRLIQISS